MILRSHHGSHTFAPSAAAPSHCGIAVCRVQLRERLRPARRFGRPRVAGRARRRRRQLVVRRSPPVGHADARAPRGARAARRLCACAPTRSDGGRARAGRRRGRAVVDLEPAADDGAAARLQRRHAAAAGRAGAAGAGRSSGARRVVLGSRARGAGRVRVGVAQHTAMCSRVRAQLTRRLRWMERCFVVGTARRLRSARVAGERQAGAPDAAGGHCGRHHLLRMGRPIRTGALTLSTLQ